MQRPGLCSRMLIAALVAGLSAGPVSARPLLLPAQVVSATGAGPRLGLVIVPLDAPAAAQQAVLELVGEDAIRVAGRFEPVPVTDLFDPKAATERAQKLEAARARMVEGQKHLDDLDTAKGTEAFADALKQLKETDTAQTFGELTRAWVMKAAGHALAGETPAAKQEIERIVAVNPKAEFNPQFFPPDLLKFVEAQRKLSNLAKGELTVSTEPPGANVWVDGQLRGRSPVTINGLLGGRHQVVATLGGRALTVAELPPGSSSLELKAAELAPNLLKAVDGCTKAPKAKGRDQALVTLGKALGVDQVLGVLVKKSPTGEQFELIGVRLEVKDGHNAGYATATVPLGEASDALKGFFDSMLVTDTPRKGKEIVTHFDGDSGGGGGKTVVGIALLGVAAGLVGAGVGTGVVGQQRYEQFRATPQVQTGIAQGYANEARLLGGVSLGSFIGAGVAAGVGIFLLASGGAGSDSSAEEPKSTKKKDPKKDTSSKKELSKKTEPKKEEPSKDEPKKDEAKKDEPKKEEVKKDEPKKDEPKVDPKEEKRRKEEEAKRAKEEEARLKKEEEARAKAEAEDKKRKEEEEEKKRKEEEASTKKLTKKEEKKKAEDDAKKKAEEDAARKAEEEKKKKDEEARRAEEERKKKEAEKKKEEDHDDLRNY